MNKLRKAFCTTFLPALFLSSSLFAQPQGSDPKALAAVRAAMASELQANQTDKSIWTYRDHDSTPGNDGLYNSIETTQGELRRLIELNGKPLTGDDEQHELDRINEFVNDPAAQAKALKAAIHDDKQATEMLRMLPDAFIWTTGSEDADTITLNFSPNPDFSPPDMQSRVMGAMAGQMIVVRGINRIRTLKGKLQNDILIGYGLIGRLYSGGTFDIERREVGGGHWQITETHVHIGGHVLLFKTIGTQEDEVKTDWKPSPAPTLKEAAKVLGATR
jgi:hypothetical protein